MQKPGLSQAEIAKFLYSEIEPVSDVFSKQAYPAAACLNDGTYLSCVMFLDYSDIVELAIRRFEATREIPSSPSSTRLNPIGYYDVVKQFVCGSNRVEYYEVVRVEKCRYTIPGKLREKVCTINQSRMTWTSFSGRMYDGQEFWFGTPVNSYFFEMPDGYSGSNLVDVTPHQNLTGKYVNGKTYFNCYLEMPKPAARK